MSHSCITLAPALRARLSFFDIKVVEERDGRPADPGHGHDHAADANLDDVVRVNNEAATRFNVLPLSK